LANFNGKEHLRHRAVSLRQHGFLVMTVITSTLCIVLCSSLCFVYADRFMIHTPPVGQTVHH